MHNAYVSDEVFAKFKQRFEAWKNVGYAGIDSELRDILPLFHEYDGVVPVLSCAGHPIQNSEHVDFYIMLAAKKEHVAEVYAIYHRLNELMEMDKQNPTILPYVQPSLTICQRPFKHDDDKDEWFHYPSITITVDVYSASISLHERLLSVVKTAISRVNQD